MEWVTQCISYMRENGFTRISASLQAEDEWVEYVAKGTEGTLRMKANSWFIGANIPGKARVNLTQPDSAPVYRAKRMEIAANGYEGFLLQ